MLDVKQVFYKIGRFAVRMQQREALTQILDIMTFDKVDNPKSHKGDSACIVCPTFVENSGGMTSILRIGVYLSHHGINVSYLVYDESRKDKLSRLEDVAKKINSDFDSRIISYKEACQKEYDFLIATSWQSIYYAKLLRGYKYYFVQDFEPFFYPVGEEYVLAKKTYTFGFHIICLGKWNESKIREAIIEPLKVDSIPFPYEPVEYRAVQRNYAMYKSKKIYRIAAYIKGSGRRIPNIIQYMLLQAKKELKKKEIDLKVYIYGMSKKEKTIVGENLGTLDKKHLFKLYKGCDFGIVASLTNISLVPYEMLATGLPLIEFKDGSASTFLGNDCAFLIDYDYMSLVNLIMNVRRDPTLLNNMKDIAQKKLNQVSWKDSCEKFLDIVNKDMD